MPVVSEFGHHNETQQERHCAGLYEPNSKPFPEHGLTWLLDTFDYSYPSDLFRVKQLPYPSRSSISSGCILTQLKIG